MNFIENTDFEKLAQEGGDKKMKKVHSYEPSNMNM